MFLEQSTAFLNSVYNCAIKSQCIYCLQSSKDSICDDCLGCFPRLITHCPVCSEPNQHGHICGHCLNRPPSFDRIISPFIYDGPITALIHRFKASSRLGGRIPGIFQVMDELAKQLQDFDFDMLVPMPYHWRRLLKRGHNPALQISRRMNKASAHARIDHALLRCKHLASQQGLKRPQRLKNLKDAFTINPAYKQTIKGKNILLIDDVVTTGATAQSASKVLKQAGAKSITVACLARTPLANSMAG